MRDTPIARQMLDQIIALGGDAARMATALKERGSGKLRRQREARLAKEWRETKSPDTLKKIYFDYIEGFPIDDKFDRWMKLLGAEGVRGPYGFRAANESTSLYVEVDAKGRLVAHSFRE